MKQEVIDKIDKVIEKACDEMTADDSITRPDDMKALAELITARANALHVRLFKPCVINCNPNNLIKEDVKK